MTASCYDVGKYILYLQSNCIVTYIVTNYLKYVCCTTNKCTYWYCKFQLCWASTLPVRIHWALKKLKQSGPSFVTCLMSGRKRPSGSNSGRFCCTEIRGRTRDRCAPLIPSASGNRNHFWTIFSRLWSFLTGTVKSPPLIVYCSLSLNDSFSLKVGIFLFRTEFADR